MHTSDVLPRRLAPSAFPLARGTRHTADITSASSAGAGLEKRVCFFYPLSWADIPKEKRQFHSLRHSIAVHLLDAGADVAFVQDRLGHANIQNTMVYMRYTTVTRDAQTRQLFASHKVL